jgi:flagellar basal-body rod protein FlgF
MDAAIYKALSGAITQMHKLDATSQDLANVNTSGYKAQRLAFNEVLADHMSAEKRVGGFVAVAAQRTHLAPGHHLSTGNPLDLAIDGDGYFVLETERGERYTRSGKFTLRADGTLITLGGERLLGESGPIQIEGGKLEVGPDGTLRSENGEIGRLRIDRFIDPNAAVKQGANLFGSERSNVEAMTSPKIVQGSLEQSNVSTIDSMISIIAVQRQFETYEKAMKLIDGATEKMISEAGR